MKKEENFVNLFSLNFKNDNTNNCNNGQLHLYTFDILMSKIQSILIL